jgi:hypothetical protein
VLIGSAGSPFANTTYKPEALLFDATSGELLQRFSDAAPADRFLAMKSNPSGSQIAIVRLRDADFVSTVLVYKVPEPASAILAVIAVGLACLSRSRCISRSAARCLERSSGTVNSLPTARAETAATGGRLRP